MPKRNQSLRVHCDFELTMDIVGGKWKGLVIYHLFKGTKRFVELKQLIPMITSRMLTLQLRELEADEIILRKVHPEVPPRVEYSLTPIGAALQPAFKSINEWGALYKTSPKTPGSTS